MPRSGPILVTGSHRSGTGWVGEILAATDDPRLAYVWEPFSLEVRRGICDAGFQLWFTYVCDENGDRYRDAIADVVALRYRPRAEVRTLRSAKDAARMARDWWRTASQRRDGAFAVMKDPIAVFSAPWLVRTFSMDAVVMIRHPAAFVNSIVSKGWRHPFDHFTRQPLLIRDYLGEFEGELHRFAASERPLIDQAILLWNVIHAAIASFEKEHPDWSFIRHEDLARAPIDGFASLYRHLGLTWSDRVATKIQELSDPRNPRETSVAASHHRDSRRAIVAWKERLTSEQVSTIRRATEPIASKYYSDDDW